MLSLSTLKQNALQVNPKLTVSTTGGQLSSDSSLLLLQEFLHRIDFNAAIRKNCHFFDPRSYCTHTSEDLFKQLLFQVIAGYQSESASDYLRKDPIFTLALDKDTLASQPTISRFIKWRDTDTFESFQALNDQLGTQFVQQLNRQEMISDVDSTHADTFVGAQLRPGNTYTSTGTAALRYQKFIGFVTKSR